MNPLVLAMIKKTLLPMLREQGGPALRKYLGMLLTRYAGRLDEGEDHVSIIIEQGRESDLLFAVCAMTADNRAARVLSIMPVDKLIETVASILEDGYGA